MHRSESQIGKKVSHKFDSLRTLSRVRDTENVNDKNNEEPKKKRVI